MRRERLSKAQQAARRAGLWAAAGIGALGLVGIIGVLVSFRLNEIETALVIIFNTATSLIAARGIYFGVSRFLLPSWVVDRLSYECTSASIDGQPTNITTPSHLVEDQWSRSFSVFVIVFWSVLWLAVLGGTFYLAATE
jgi:hypothetical protein